MKKQSVMDEIEDLEKYIEAKVEDKVKLASNKWSKMGTKQRLDLVFVSMGIIAFSISALNGLKSLRRN
tara:strand:- start:107 stop:310 length:204 start_codon:yes stop_codon:yes gene_type:complete